MKNTSVLVNTSRGPIVDENDLIYDPMCGSGTTAQASQNLQRKCIINDINIDTLEIIKSRFN